jgi:hypothetical protein
LLALCAGAKASEKLSQRQAGLELDAVGGHGRLRGGMRPSLSPSG